MNQLAKKLQDAQDDQQSKQLDLREQALADKEKLLNESELLATVELLDKQIAFKEQRLIEVDQAIRVSFKDHHIKKQELQDSLSVLERKVAKAQNNYNGLVKRTEGLEEQNVATQKTLQTVKDDIATQKRYLKTQEEVVNQAVAEWNDQLNGFHQEGELIAERKEQHSVDIIRLDQEKVDKQTKLEQLDEKIAQVQSVYDEKIATLRNDLQVINSRLQDKENKLSELNITLEQRLQAVMTREQAISIREAASRETEQDLIDREKRLNLRLNLVN